jgi:hypothetical protein
MASKPQPRRRLSSEIRKAQEKANRQVNSPALYGTGLSVVDTGQLMQDGSVTIPNNGLLLVDGGDVVMLDAAPSATEIFRLGVQQYGDRGITIRRNDGTTAIEVKNSFSSTDPRQSFIIRDPAGRAIGGDSILAGSGFDAPNIPIPFIPADPTNTSIAVTTSATAFTATHEHRGFRQNPALKPQYKVKCSDGTTTCDIQVWDVLNSVYLGGFLGSPATLTISVPAGTSAFTVFEFASALALPGLMGDAMQLELHVKRTAGTGSITIAPVRSFGSGF